MKVYLDTNVVSAIAREDFPEDEMRALKQLLELSNTGNLELRTSEVARREIESYKGEDKRTVEIVYLLLQKVPIIEDHKVLGYHSTYPLVEDHPISAALRQMRLERADAHHLMVAIRAQCEVFLTRDEGILRRHAEIKARFRIRPLTPATLARTLSLVM